MWDQNPVPTQKDAGREGSALLVSWSFLSLFLDEVKEITAC